MNNNYDRILKQLKSKRNIFIFTEEDLNKLTDEERNKIEERIIRLCKYGIESAYEYIPILKNQNVEKLLQDNEIDNLLPESKNLIIIYMYIRTKKVEYLEKLDEEKINARQLTLLLKYYNLNKENQQLILKINNLINSNKKYKNLVKIITNTYKNDDFENIDTSLITNGILGFAVGDALGVPVEFTTRSARKQSPISEMIGYGSHNVPEGTWSDDTSMTICTMDSIIENQKINYEDMMTKFCLWAKNANYTATDEVFDIGITTRMALSNYYSRKTPAINCGMSDERSNGNGSLMRMLPIAMYLYANKFTEEEEVKIINDTSSLTHSHEISKLGCKIYCDYMKEILKGRNPIIAYEIIQRHNYKKYYSIDSINNYSRLLQGNIKKVGEYEISSSGYIVSTLEAAIWCTLNSNSYEESVKKAVNLGDDTDTIGAIVGGINGCIYHNKDIPSRWLSKLRKKTEIENLAIKYAEILNIIRKNTSKNQEQIIRR